MSKSSVKRKIGLKLLKFSVIFLCLGGFLYQTLQFLFLYWTYPTVVDIQEISPSNLEMPAFTICNPIGYDYAAMCKFKGVCASPKMNRISARYICKTFPESCTEDGKLPPDFTPIAFSGLMQRFSIKPEHHDLLRQRLEEYAVCTIEFAGVTRECNLENVMGSFYSKDDLPQYCYSIYSLWGQPNKEREFIQKGAKMKFHFALNTTRREFPDNGESPKPLFNVPTNPAVQIAVHSPYFLPSPFIEGTNYMGGRSYEMRITMKETHLLPHPYQTNCTDYMKLWLERGGKAPINQLGVVQECRLNKTFEALGCIPITLDYPHNYTICQSCSFECDYNVSTDECTLLADSYNQPCDSIFYTTQSEKRMMYIFQDSDIHPNESLEDGRTRILEHDCGELKFWNKVCSVIDIEVLFDRFQSTKLTYNPKFESLELFSVVGGYLGMWLGVSLLTVYDFLGTLVNLLRTAYIKKKRNRIQLIERNKPRRRFSQSKDSTQVTTYWQR